MRKSLVLALVAASMLWGCGYDNGKDEDTGILLALPASCTTAADCMENGVILGLCEDGVCRRSCVETKDCEDKSVCDSGVCRPVIDCPTMSFGHLSGDALQKSEKKYKNAKCIKVFSHTPSISYANALNADVDLTRAQLNNPTKTGDFTSDNYTFSIPKEALDHGLSFGMITYATLRFINLLAASSNGLAECFRPEVINENYEYAGIGSYKYISSYHYAFTNQSLDNNAVVAMCNESTDGLIYDMMAYAIYQYHVNYKGDMEADAAIKLIDVSKDKINVITQEFNEIIKELHMQNNDNGENGGSSDNGENGGSSDNGENGGSSDENGGSSDSGSDDSQPSPAPGGANSKLSYEGFLEFLYNQYMEMIKMKKTCIEEKTTIDNMMVMARLTAQVAGDKQSRLATMAGAVNTYVSDPETIIPSDDYSESKELIGELRKPSSLWKNSIIDTLKENESAIKELKINLNINMLESLEPEILVDTLIEKIKPIIESQTFEKIPPQNRLLIENFYNVLLMAKYWVLSNLPQDFKNENYCTIINSDGASPATNTNCSKFSGAVDDNVIFKDSFLYVMSNAIMNSQKRLCIETMSGVQDSTAFARFIASNDMQLDACIMSPNLPSALIDMSKHVTEEHANKILYSGDFEAIHGALGDPRYFWFSNADLLPIDIKLNEQYFNKTDALIPKGLILETIYDVPQTMFKGELIGDTYLQVLPAESVDGTYFKYTNYTTGAINYCDLQDSSAQATALKSLNSTVVSTRNGYLQTDSLTGSHHSFLYDIDLKNDDYSSANAFDFTDGKNNCNKGSKCTFEFSVLSKRLVDSLESGGSDTGDPYKCGGFVYNVSRINGYVVVPDNIKYSGRSVKTSKDN